MGIRNTTKDAQDNPFLTALTTTMPGGIEAQESAGQRQLVNSASLPTEGSEDPAWAKLGVTFGAPDADDPLFRPATLPTGWRKVATDHAMHSSLVDDKGRKRAAIFYKAAFYDRRADMHLERRFNIQRVYDRDNYDLFQTEVIDCGTRVFVTEAVDLSTKAKDWDAKDATERAQRVLCAAWLDERFPQWKDVAAHWD